MTSLSTLATFDDIRRCVNVLCDGTAEEEFLKFAAFQEEYRLQWRAAVQEAERLQRELDASLKRMAELEAQVWNAREIMHHERQARKEAEQERDRIEKRLIAVAELLQNDRGIRDETKDKLAFLNTFSKKRKSLSTHAEETIGNDINCTDTFLSHLSLTQSEDDFLDTRTSKQWRKHRPSLPKDTETVYIGAKKSRLSTDGNTAATRRSSRFSSSKQTRQSRGGVLDTICSTTTVTVPTHGECTVRAEAIIPNIVVQDVEAPTSRVSLNVIKPSAPLLEERNQKFHSPSRAKINMRPHNFVSKTFIRTDTCTHCQKKIRFGSLALKCRDCHVCCHTDCSENLAITCVPQTGTPNMKGMMGVIADYAPNISPMIPALIVHCVNEIETRGLNEVGIYRVSGSEREVKALKERFLRNKGTPHLSNIDVHTLCGCVKDFLRSLREPLIPTDLWRNFSNAVQNVNSANIQSDLYRALDSLPQANRDTLSFLILHFQRVAECPEVKMPLENIARVFGPTIVGYSTADPDQHAIFTETVIQFNVMQHLMKIPTDFWARFVALDLESKPSVPPHKLQKTPSSAKDTLYSLYATPFKGTLKKRKFYATPPHSSKK